MSRSIPPPDSFAGRHIGPDEREVRRMLEECGHNDLTSFIDEAVPAAIRTRHRPAIPARSESAMTAELAQIAGSNQNFRSLIGTGYYGTITPPVIRRNILENPGWYTQYTPYQSEIAQGRLEALLNFQTAVIDLTGFPVANASLLDEATAAAEAMAMFHGIKGRQGTFFVADDCHPQTIAVVRTRATPLGIKVVTGPAGSFDASAGHFGALIQYPSTDGAIRDYSGFCRKAHDAGALVVVAADPLALALLTPPGEFGADAAVGSMQRFGVPLFCGGPHAAYFATRDEFKRQIPGRIIGVSVDGAGSPALRMALQTREQHIRREKATSNICTAQALLAIMAGAYAVWHGPAGIRRIAERIHGFAQTLAEGAEAAGHKVVHKHYFDTLRIAASGSDLAAAFAAEKINVRRFSDGSIGVSLDELTDDAEVKRLVAVLAAAPADGRSKVSAAAKTAAAVDGASHAPALDGAAPAAPMQRTTTFLSHPVFNTHRSETAMMRYIKSLEERDLSLTTSMIPLGSCTMKLNAASELFPVTWPSFAEIHPLAPAPQRKGYASLVDSLDRYLRDLTGFAGFSFQPNSGAQGEYAGLLAIRGYHESRGEQGRRICLIPSSAHGTNPASAIMAGLDVVVVRATADGSVDLADLREKAAAAGARLSALMITYPSTHGVFEETIREICDIVHASGGQVYMDGANLNAQIGLARPAELGADVCHVNLHKTFCIPHGGGGPGAGPIGVAAHLVPFLPGDPSAPEGSSPVGPVSAALWGSAGILPISWAYITMMGGEGLSRATKVAILSANYMARRLEPHFPVLFKGPGGWVAHEFILDLRPVKQSAGVGVDDVAKRLMDYGFHAPTTSFPVPGTLMVEPTESEDLAELDRFCDAMISIRKEIAAIEDGRLPREDNPLVNAPHKAAVAAADTWTHPYSRTEAVYPSASTKRRKFWPPVGRIDNAAGDKTLICSCPPVSEYETGTAGDEQAAYAGAAGSAAAGTTGRSAAGTTGRSAASATSQKR